MGSIVLVFVHLGTDGLTYKRTSMQALAQDTARVLPLAAIAGPFLVASNVCLDWGLTLTIITDAMILSTGTPLFAMSLGKIFLSDDVLWTYLLIGWMLCVGGTFLVGYSALKLRNVPER